MSEQKKPAPEIRGGNRPADYIPEVTTSVPYGHYPVDDEDDEAPEVEPSDHYAHDEES